MVFDSPEDCDGSGNILSESGRNPLAAAGSPLPPFDIPRTGELVLSVEQDVRSESERILRRNGWSVTSSSLRALTPVSLLHVRPTLRLV
jgi:hypothetical protein